MATSAGEAMTFILLNKRHAILIRRRPLATAAPKTLTAPKAFVCATTGLLETAMTAE